MTTKPLRKKESLDHLLLIAALTLGFWGLVMVASTSIAVSERLLGNTTYFLMRQALFLGLGSCFGWFVYHIPLKFWQATDRIWLITCLLLLALVLIPGIGHEVNGSRRWIAIAWFHLQVSEFAKLAMILFIAGYSIRHRDSMTLFVKGFVNPMIVVSLMSILLLLEPDFGAVVVVTVTSIAMLFLGGVRIRHFLLVIAACLLLLTLLAISSPYRWGRLTAFMNPWADQFNSGYQLTQALIAFGRGDWFGVGLGSSVQKLFYLPEAHTDFMFAVIGEELGFVGLCLVIALFAMLCFRGLQIGIRALTQQNEFAGFVAVGISLWIGLQALISMGVNVGLLPTKGLTLPLMSYGGSSLIVSCMSVGLLLRISVECPVQPKRKAL